jgi:hypothetical protein
MAHAARVSQNIVAALVRKSELCSGDIANHDDDRIGQRMARVVRNGSRNGERLWRLRCGTLPAKTGNRAKCNEQAYKSRESWGSIHFFLVADY